VSGGPLAGLRVLDTATLYAGPFISTVLADHGADVIKIEPPGGDGYRHGAHRMWPLLARNKRSVVADLRSTDGSDLVRALAVDLDVLVINMPARLLVGSGLDYDSLRAINPGLIYVHVTAYGLDGPYGDRPGSGTLGEALAGLTHMTGAADGPPVLPSVALGDAITGYVGAFGVLAACYHRLAHGASGQLIDVNPVDAMLQMTGPVLTQHDEGAPPPSRLGSRLTGSLLRGVFRTSDDGWVAISASTPRHLREIAELCGHPSPDGAAAPDGSAAPAGDVAAQVELWLSGRGRAEAIAEFAARRLPIAPVATAQDVLDDEHLLARGAVRYVHTAEHGPIAGPAPAPRLTGCAADLPWRTPDLDEDGAAIRKRLLLSQVRRLGPADATVRSG
jgi:crotonobetainyl-CoA:carnitine CoA-transferase CaiB-like acyl-CoA transferase